MKIRIIITPSPLFSDVSMIFQVMVLELPDPNIKLSIVAIWREHQHNSTYVIEDVFFFGRLNQFSRMKLSKSKTRDGVLVIQFPAEVTYSGLRGKCVSVTEPGHLHDTEPGISKTHARLLRRRRIIDSSHGEFWRHGMGAPRFVVA
jgi:hypothetical protein